MSIHRSIMNEIFMAKTRRGYKPSEEMIKFRKDRHKTDEHHLDLQEEAEIAEKTAEVWDEKA